MIEEMAQQSAHPFALVFVIVALAALGVAATLTYELGRKLGGRLHWIVRTWKEHRERKRLNPPKLKSPRRRRRS